MREGASRRTTKTPSPSTIRKIKLDYFHWLCEIICVDQDRDSYWILAKALHNIAYFWSVPNDDNRGMDGLRLRDDYFDENPFNDAVVLDEPCTMLEMLIGLARRIEEIMAEAGTDDQTPKWFWEMMENLGLNRYTDANFSILYGDARVPHTVQIVLERSYKRNGEGGLFPLRRPKKDQRKVEIWYQMSTYLVENYFLETLLL